MTKTTTRFPPGFLWGVATSAYQIEGAAQEDGRGPSIWDTFCRAPGAIDDGSNGDVTCDHYHRVEQDLDLMVSLGVSAYRFSISWPRVQPDGMGAWNPKGIGFYDRLVDGLLKRNIKPFVTLYHWDLPQPLQDLGGWAHRDTARRFAHYAEYVARALGDRLSGIITHNEPWCTSMLGHRWGKHAPGIQDMKTAMQVSHHLLLSHGWALQAMRAAGTRTPMGIVLNIAPTHAATDSANDVARAWLDDGYSLRWYMDPLFHGRYPADVIADLGDQAPSVEPGDLDAIRVPIDFLGVNYYMRGYSSHDESAAPPGPHGFTMMDWEIYPPGLTELLVRLKRDYALPPIYITENGAAFVDALENGRVHDTRRVEYVRMHLDALAEALAAGVDVRGYFLWSLLDNFEWGYGYGPRFGIVYIDYATQRRIVKDSGFWYRDFIAAQPR